MPQTINNMVQEWTNSLTTYTAIKMNIPTDVSAAGSLLMDLQVGGSSKFKVAKSGAITVPDGTAAEPSIAFAGATTTGLYQSGGQLAFSQSGVLKMYVSSSGIFTLSGVGLDLAFNANPNIRFGVSADLIIGRRAAANLRLGAADTGAVTSTVTITIAAPGVVTWTSHGFSTGTPVVFTTTGALPTGITAGTTYYAVVVDANTFQIASSVANAIAATPTVITTSGTQSGTHTGTRYNITQRLSMQGITGVADRLGADLIIQGSQGTGTGAGGSIIFQVAPAGTISGGAVNALATALTINGDARTITLAPTRTDYGVIASGTDAYKSIGFIGSGANTIAAVRNHGGVEGLVVRNTSVIGWLNTSEPVSGSIDNNAVLLYRDAANTLALRNGANAQTFRVYNTTDGTNSEFLESIWSGNTAYIQTNKAGTGTSIRKLYLSGLGIRLDPTPTSGGTIEILAANIATDTTTGIKLGTATGQKIGFWNATPIVQPTTAVAAATVAATGVGDVVAASTTFDGYTIPQIVKALRNAGLLA